MKLYTAVLENGDLFLQLQYWKSQYQLML